MQVFRGIPETAIGPAVVTIGNFDGVHLGHQALLARLTGFARGVALPASVVTFEPHPREFFAPASAPTRLCSLREKLVLLAEQGIDRVFVCPFNARLAALDADAFIERILVRGLRTRHLVIGDDFRFGRGRGGDFARLQEAGASYGFGVEAMHSVLAEGERASSSGVREALAGGDLARAERLLGRAYSIAGRVMHGDKIGRTLGFSTANIQLKHNRPPLLGIYVVEVEGIGPRPLPGVASLGVRPTVNDAGRPVLEVHLLDYDGDLYCAHLTVHFRHKLRDEAKYPDLEALRAAIANDVDQTRAWFRQREAA